MGLFADTNSLRYKNFVDGVHCTSGSLTNNGLVDDDLEIFGITYRTISTNPLFRVEYVQIPGKHPYVTDKLHS
jgi:hypothetical protein